MFDSDWRRRWFAAQTINTTNTPRVVDAMIYALRDNYKNVRLEATQYLGRFRVARALPELERLAGKWFEDKGVKESARFAIRRIKGQE